ncbi:MAG: hypothetical protein DME32_07730 [Verrucomicrobia bacterium]|nr:MAG: hypothetical protein DME32_07730 [Verrucomicrobiota bacterium]
MTPLAGKNNWWFDGNLLPIYLRSILKEFSNASVAWPSQARLILHAGKFGIGAAIVSPKTTTARF